MLEYAHTSWGLAMAIIQSLREMGKIGGIGF
jgi:hypothetical protein